MSKLRHRLPLPLEIDCSGLSGKLIRDLADRLSLHFVDVKLSGTDITATSPLNQKQNRRCVCFAAKYSRVLFAMKNFVPTVADCNIFSQALYGVQSD